MPQIQYAFRDDAKTIAMLTQGSTEICPLCQIVTLRKREIAPEFLEHYMVMDIKGTNFPASALTDYGRTLNHPENHRKFIAIIDSQIEFTVKSRTMKKLAEFMPAYTGTALYNFFEGQPYGYLLVLRLYSITEEIPDELMAKGRMGSSQIISLYDKCGEKTEITFHDNPKPIVDEGTFEYIKYEILHALRVENALIGVYGSDDKSKRLLQQKRDYYTGSVGTTYKHTFNEEDNIDRAQIDYEEVFSRVLSIEPSLSTFISYVREIKPPQMVEWRAMLSRSAKGDLSAKHRVVEMYLRNVIRISLYYYEKYGIPIEDTIQNGVLGLMTAVEKFDMSATDTFQQYYPLWVRQVIQREMPRYLYTRYFPMHTFEKMLIIKKIARENGLNLPEDYVLIDEGFIEKVSRKLDVSINVARKYIRYLVPEISLNEYLDETEETGEFLCEELTYDGCEEIIEHIQCESLRQALDEVLRTLTPREESMMRLRFGFVDEHPRTLEEVGRVFNVTRERIRQVEAKALRKLRHPSRSRKLREYLD